MSTCKACEIIVVSPIEQPGDCATNNTPGSGGTPPSATPSCSIAAPGRPSCPTDANCSPWDLADGPEDCLAENVIEEQLNISGADLLVHKLLGVHEQYKLQDVTGLGEAISSGSLANNPASNAFDMILSSWASSHTGANVISNAYIGYDFGPIRLDNGRLRYALETYTMKDIATLSIKQGCLAKNRATKIRIERSSDGQKWFGVAVVNLKDCNGLVTVNFKRSVPSRWWRIRPVAFNGGVNDPWIVHALQLSEYEATHISNIQDKVLMENRDRSYEKIAVKMRGQYSPIDSQSFLARFGMDQMNDNYVIEVSFKQAVARLGRPFVIGDIIVLPSETQYSPDLAPVLKYLEVEDVTWSSNGYTAAWTPTLQRLSTRPAVASQETQDVMGKLTRDIDSTGLFDIDQGTNDKTYQDMSDISQTIKSESLVNVPVKGSDFAEVGTISDALKEYSKLHPNMNIQKLDRRRPLQAVDALPPDGLPYTEADEFPKNPKDGAYHRLTYSGKNIPPVLYKYSSKKKTWRWLEQDRKHIINDTRPMIQEFIDPRSSSVTHPAKVQDEVKNSGS